MVRLDDPWRGRQLGQPDEPLTDPILVGVLRGDTVLELVIRDDALFDRVDQEHAARLEAALGHDLRGVYVQHTGLGRHDDAAVRGDVVASRSQAVSVQRGADPDAVRESDRGRPVPRLHQAGMELVEGLLLRGHRLVVLPGLGHHHHQRVGHAPAGEVEQLEGVVQDGRVRAVDVDRRQGLGQLITEQFGVKLALAGMHPVDVAAQGVDLAVVGDVAIRVRPRPGREGVGREARVDHGDGALDALVVQIRVEGPELRGVEHALVDHRPAAQRRNVEVAPAGDGGPRHGLLDQAPNDV